IGATAFTGSRTGGLRLKEAADKAGKPIYLEMSSINPVVVLPGALEERLDAIVGEFTTSCLMAAGQFCTNPGLVLLVEGPLTEQFVQAVGEKFAAAPAGPLLSLGVKDGLATNVAKLIRSGAKKIAG